MFKFYRSVLAAGVVALGLAACGDNVTVTQPVTVPPGVTSVTVTPANATVGVGQSIQLAPNVVADSGIATTLNWTSSNQAIATVSGTGLVTGVSVGTTTVVATSTANPARSAAVQITVSLSAPFTVSPANLSLAPGQSSSATAQVTLGAGQTATNVVWTSLSPAIATVSSSCTTSAGGVSICPITGVSQGTAVITATTTVGGVTLNGTVAVTVGAGAGVSIAAVNQGTGGCPGAGTVGAPVLLTNVVCQIDVNLNFNPGVQRIDSLVVSMKQGSTFKRVGKQTYNGTIPSAGLIVLSVNTANFTKNATTGVANVDLYNGPTNLLAQVYTTGGGNTGATNCQIGSGDGTCSIVNSMVLNNADGWAATLTKPTVAAAPTAVPATGGFTTALSGTGASSANPGDTYWGGPGTTGQSTAVLYSVVYNDNPAFAPGSALNRCGNTLGDGTGCVTKVTWTIGTPGANCGGTAQTALPFKQVFGTGTGATKSCSGYENATAQRDNIVVQSALDAQANTFPVSPLIANAVVPASTPDSARYDYKAPTINVTPSVARATPAVTGWVNAGFDLRNWTNISDVGSGLLGIGTNAANILAARIAAGAITMTYSAAQCGGGAASIAMPTGKGADIPECAVNAIGGLAGIGTGFSSAGVALNTFTGSTPDYTPGASPYQVTGFEVDRLGNQGTTGPSATFGVDKTAPAIRWGVGGDPTYATAAVNQANVDTLGNTVDTIFATSKPTTEKFRVEYLDLGVAPAGFIGVSAQGEALSVANHANPSGLCIIQGGGTLPPIGPNFVTNPNCKLATNATAGALRLDGWQAGHNLAVPTGEGYYFYRSQVTDAAGNPSVIVSRRLLVNANNPFASVVGITTVETAANMTFFTTFADSAEVINSSMQLVYPNVPTTDSLRYSQAPLVLAPAPATCVATPIPTTAKAFDDCITSPFGGNISPNTGAPYARSVEVVNATAFAPGAQNFPAVYAANVKPTKVQAWSWNPGNHFSASAEQAIPALNVQDGVGIANWNTNNPTLAINFFRVLAPVSGNQFGSASVLRAQVAAPTNSPNAPFTRVDFYRLDASNNWWNYLGSVNGGAALASDQGTYRSWVYGLDTNLPLNWAGAAQGATAAGDKIIAIGVVATGDALSTLNTTMTP